MNSLDQSSSNNNKENVVNLGGSAKPSTAPPAASSALSFRERLEQQLKKAKELQKQAQIDLEITKKDSVKKDDPAPTFSSNIQNPSTLSSTTALTSSQAPTVSMASSFSSRFSSILQRDQTKTSLLNTPSSTSSTAQTIQPASAENKFSAISSRLSQLRESLNQTLSNSEIKLPSQTVSSIYNRETKSEIRELSDNKQSINKKFLQETNKQISDLSATSIVPNIKANIQSSTDSFQAGISQIKKNEDSNQDCIIVEEKSTLKPKQTEVEMCIEIEANPKDLIQQKINYSINKSYVSSNSTGTPKNLESSSQKIDSSIKSNTSSIKKLSSSKGDNKCNSPNARISNQIAEKMFQGNENQGIKLSESSSEIKNLANNTHLKAEQSINTVNPQSVKSQLIDNQAKIEDQLQNKSKQVQESNIISMNNSDFNSEFQQNKTQNDILKIIDNIPSSSESDLSQINSQPDSQQTQDQYLLKQETKNVFDILNHQPILPIQDDKILNKQLNNEQNKLQNCSKYETQEDRIVNEEKSFQNQQNSEIKQQQNQISQNIIISEQKGSIKIVEKELSSGQKSSIKSVEKVFSSGKKSYHFELNETKQQNIISEETYQNQNSFQTSDLNLTQNEKKYSVQKQEINQIDLFSQLKTSYENQIVKESLNEEQQILKVGQNMDEEINKANQTKQELNSEQNNQNQLKNESKLVVESNQAQQNSSIQLSYQYSSQIKSTSQSSELFQQEISLLETQKSEGQLSFEQNQIQTKQTQNGAILEVDQSKQSAQKLSQILDTIDRMEQEEEDEQKIQIENIQNQQNQLNQQENTQIEEEEQIVDNNSMEFKVQNNTDLDVLQNEQQIHNDQTTILLEGKNEEQIEETQKKSKVCQNLNKEDIKFNNKPQEKLITSNKSSLKKDLSITNVISQIEQCEKLEKIIDEDKEENFNQINNLQMLKESQGQINQNEKKSLEKLVDSNKSSLQKDKKLSSILSKIEELEQMEDVDEHEQYQENKIEKFDNQSNNLEQKIQMDKEYYFEISINNNQLQSELNSTQYNQSDIQESINNQNELNQQINQNKNQKQNEELLHQDGSASNQNQSQIYSTLNQVQESNQQQEKQNEMSIIESNFIIDPMQSDINSKIDEYQTLNQCLVNENNNQINIQEQNKINSQLLKIIDKSSSSSNNSQEITTQQNEQQFILNFQNKSQQLDQINQESLINESDKQVEEKNDQIKNKCEDQNQQIENSKFQFSNQIQENDIQDQEQNQQEKIQIQSQQNHLLQEDNIQSIKQLNVDINQINDQNSLNQTEQINYNTEQNQINQQDIMNDDQQNLHLTNNLSQSIVEEKQQLLHEEQQTFNQEIIQSTAEAKDKLIDINKEQIIEENQHFIHEQEQQNFFFEKQQQEVKAKEQQSSQAQNKLQIDTPQYISQLKQSIQVEGEVQQQVFNQSYSQIHEEKSYQEQQIQQQYYIEQKQLNVEHYQSPLIEEKQQQNIVTEDQQLQQEKQQSTEEIDEQQQQVKQQSVQSNIQILEEEQSQKQQHVEEQQQQQQLIDEQNKQIFQCGDKTYQQKQLDNDKQQNSVEPSQVQYSVQQKEQVQIQQQQLLDQEESQNILTEEQLQKTEEKNKSELVIDKYKQLKIQEEQQATSIINNQEENKIILLQNDEIQQDIQISLEQEKQIQQTVILDIEQQNQKLLNSKQVDINTEQNIQKIDSKVLADGALVSISNSNDQLEIQVKLDDNSQIEIENEDNNIQDKQQEDAMEIETQIDEQPDHLNQYQFDQTLEQNLQVKIQSNNNQIKDLVFKDEQDISKTKETDLQQKSYTDVLDSTHQKEIIQQDNDYQKISDKDLKEEFDDKKQSSEFIEKDSPNSHQITQMITSDKKEEISNKSEVKLEDVSNKIGSVMLDMEKFLKQKGLSGLKNQQTEINSEVKTQNSDILLTKKVKLSQDEQEEKQSSHLKLRNDQNLEKKDLEQPEKKNQLFDQQQAFDIVNINNTILSQIDKYLAQKSHKKEQLFSGENCQEKKEIQQIESADKNHSFGNSSENIFERIKRESDKKQQESGFQINSGQRDSLIVTNIFTPSNAKAVSDCGGAQTQFSNESFGITPKRINFLQSNKKSEAEIILLNADSQFQQLSQSKLLIAHDDQKLTQSQEEITQNFSISNYSSQLNSSNDNSKQQMGSELKMRTPLNHQVVLQIEEKKNAAKAPSSYTVISNRSNVLKSPVLTSQNNDKKTFKSNLIRDRSNSKSPGRQGLNLPQSQIEKPKGKSPLRQGVSFPKSAMRDDLSISSVNLSRFDLENEEYESKNLQSSTITQKRIQIPGDLTKIAQTLGIPKHNRNQCQLIENIYNFDKNICKLMLNQSGKNIFYQTLALLDDSIPNHFIVVVTNQFMTLRSKMNKQVSWACINSLMGVETLVQVQNLLMERKIKLLFIQQEYLLQEQYRFMRDQIKMIIYEDMTDKMLEINQIYNIQRYHLFNTMTFKTLEQVNQICEKYSLVNIDEQINLYGFDFSNINWTFESDKEKSLINFIRKNNLKKVIMYIDKSKKIDEIVSSFNQKGLKMQAYNNQKQDQILQLFSKDQFEILCCYNGQYIPKQIKQIVQYYIHYHIPRSVTSYVNDLNGYQYYHIQKGFIYEKFACGFLTELDFFEIRSDMVQELTEKKLIQTVLKTLNSNGTDGSQNKKKAGPAISDDFFFNVVLDETEQKIQEHYNHFMKGEDEFNIENESEANIKQIQITKFINENCIKREVLIKILSYIAADQVQIMPFQGVVKMIQKNQLANNKIVSTLLKNNQNKTNITFSILDLATELQMTSQELNHALKKLNSEKKLQYEVKEELALLTIKPNIDQIFDKLFEQIRFQEEKQINDLDTMYLCAKLTCNLTLEQVFKYQKYKDMNKSSNLQEEGTVSLKILLEKYLNESKGNQMCEIFTNIEKSRLPFISLKSQREKSNLLKDIQNLVPRVQKSKLNLVEFQLNKDFSQMDFESQSRFISLILQGIDGKNINEFKPALQFKKYFKYDYFDILQISFEYLQSYYTSLLQSETSKKIKI